MAQKKVPPVQLEPKIQRGAADVRAAPIKVKKAAPAPPQIHIESKMRRYADVPAFGFDILEITVNGVKVEVYRACSFADNGGIPVMILPTHNGYACMSEAEADAYK